MLKGDILKKSARVEFMNKNYKSRCFWVNLKNPLYIKYHDEEWSKPCRDDKLLYKLLILESFQAGLSWECILNKERISEKPTIILILIK